jgi:hypothetical protein
MTEYSKEYEEAVKAGETKTISPEYLEFKKAGDIIVGLLKGKSVVESSRGQGSYNQYMVDTDKGMVKFALGQATDREIEPVLRPGRTYAFIFEGKEKLTGGRSVNKFKVVAFGVTEGPPNVGDDDIPF